MPAQTGTLNYQWAFSLIHYLNRHNISQAVISPGSRSTPLALACEKHPAIKTWIDIDERSAGFFALGLSQASQHPVLLICTSGTAVANWLPAVIEASYSYTPLFLLSADRPDELQNCGANQTINQSFLFGSNVREFIPLEHPQQRSLDNGYLKQTIDHAYSRSLSAKPGPVHINIPLREPLLPLEINAKQLNNIIEQLGLEILTSEQPTHPDTSEPRPLNQSRLQTIQTLLNNQPGLIICGRLTSKELKDLQPVLSSLADKLNCPVLIDPLSGLRLTENCSRLLLINYDTFLDKADFNGQAPQWIIHLGQFPLSKKLQQYLQQQHCQRIIVSSYGDCLDPLHTHKLLVNTLPKIFCQVLLPLVTRNPDSRWLTQWQDAEHQAGNRINRSLNNEKLFEGHVINTLLQAIPAQSLIFSGNSMAIRDFDTFINHTNSGDKNLKLYANRGASGIDGNISTFAGLLAAQPDHYGVAVLGDLSFFHDMNGLLMLRQLQKQGYNGTVILLNNHGGGIFNYLPPSQLNEFEKLWQTDTGLEFRHCADLYQLNYIRITQVSELEQLTKTFRQNGFTLVEVIIDAQTSVKCHRQI